MKTTIGIDIGGSTTKIVGFRDGEMICPLMIKASDPKASIFGAFGKFMDETGHGLSDVEKIMVTGVGSTVIEGDIYGIRADKVDEFRAVGRGGLFLTGLDRAIVVSMGTGTFIVSASGRDWSHIGGTGLGGGTLLGLSNRMLNVRDFNSLIKIAEGGSLRHVDLQVGDMTAKNLHTLPKNTTASNFGRISDLASQSDIAMGIINLVFQSIGVMSMFASRQVGVDKIVLVGTLTMVPYARKMFDMLEPLYGIEYIIPEHAMFGTSVGAALCGGE